MILAIDLENHGHMFPIVAYNVGVHIKITNLTTFDHCMQDILIGVFQFAL